MKSIESKAQVFKNTCVLPVDFLNEHCFIVTVTSTEIFIGAFMVSWRFCDLDNESTGYKESFKTELPKLPCHTAESNIFRTATNLGSKRAKFNVDFENNWLFRKTFVRDENFPDSLEIARIFL